MSRLEIAWGDIDYTGLTWATSMCGEWQPIKHQTLDQHWVNVSCLLGIDFICFFCLSRWLPAWDFQSGGRDQQSKLARVLPQPQRLHLALHHHPGTQGQTGKTRTLAVLLRRLVTNFPTRTIIWSRVINEPETVQWLVVYWPGSINYLSTH